jgi:hypothetical protein
VARARDFLRAPPPVPPGQPFTLQRMTDATLAVYRELLDVADASAEWHGDRAYPGARPKRVRLSRPAPPPAAPPFISGTRIQSPSGVASMSADAAKPSLTSFGSAPGAVMSRLHSSPPFQSEM